MPIELPRRGKNEPVPVLDGRPARLWAIYAIGPKGVRGPLRLGHSQDPRGMLADLQRATWKPLYIHELAWVRNERFAELVLKECQSRIGNCHISASWYRLRPAAALDLFRRAAATINVPIASHDQYLMYCRPLDDVLADLLLANV